MKITQAASLVSVLLFSGGCAQQHSQAHYDESIPAPASQNVNDGSQVAGGAMKPTSHPNQGSSFYHDASDKVGDEAQNQPRIPTANGGNNEVNSPTSAAIEPTNRNAGRPLSPTANETNGAPRLYHDASNSMNLSTNNILNPTSRTNGERHIYQESEHHANTNSSGKIP